jgi:hypothetical protein
MSNRLIDLGQAREEILAAWIANEKLRACCPGSHQHARPDLPPGLSTSGAPTPSCTASLRPSRPWWGQIEAFILTGAAGEGVNG